MCIRDSSMAIVLHGFIRADRLPIQPSDAALKNLRMIYFLKNDMTILQPTDCLLYTSRCV